LSHRQRPLAAVNFGPHPLRIAVVLRVVVVVGVADVVGLAGVVAAISIAVAVWCAVFVLCPHVDSARLKISSKGAACAISCSCSDYSTDIRHPTSNMDIKFVRNS